MLRENIFYPPAKPKNENRSNYMPAGKKECECKFRALFIENNSNRSSFSYFGALYENFPPVIIFHNAFYKRQAQPPPPFLRCKSRLKDGFEFCTGNTFACICDIYIHKLKLVGNLNGNFPCPIHGIHGIAAEIFNDPLEERNIELHINGMYRHCIYRKLYALGSARLHVIHRFFNHFKNISFLKHRDGTY